MGEQPYKKQPDDKMYRIVNVNKGVLPSYRNFQEDSVNIPSGCVIEILKEDDSEFLAPLHDVVRIDYCIITNENKIYLPAGCSTERIWARSRLGGIEMKVPNNLVQERSYQYMYIPGGADQVELVGDKYFNSVYLLHRT